MVSKRAPETPEGAGLEAEYGRLFLKNFQRDFGSADPVRWDISPYSWIQLESATAHESNFVVDSPSLAETEDKATSTSNLVPPKEPPPEVTPTPPVRPFEVEEAVATKSDAVTENQAIADCWKPPDVPAAQASPWGSVDEAPVASVDTGGSPQFVAFWPEPDIAPAQDASTEGFAAFPPADVDPLSFFSAKHAHPERSAFGRSANAGDSTLAAAGSSSPAQKAAATGGFGSFLAPPPPPRVSVGSKDAAATVVVPVCGGATEVQAEAVPIVMVQQEVVKEDRPKWKVFSEREEGAAAKQSANTEVKADDEVEQGKGIDADAEDADVDEDACELLLGNEDHGGGISVTPADLQRSYLARHGDGIDDDSESEEGELDSEEEHKDSESALNCKTSLDGDPLPRDRSSEGSSPDRRPPSPPRPAPVEATPMVTASGSRRGVRQPAKVDIPASAAFQEGPPQESEFTEKEDTGSKDLERKLADRLDHFFKDEDKWKQVAEELSHNPQLRESMGLLRVLSPVKLRFQVDVPTPHPGIQYRRSKNLEDRYPNYAVQGAMVAGYVEDDWLRISKNLWLPFEVRGMTVLRACGEATEEDDLALDMSSMVNRGMNRSLSSGESYTTDGSPGNGSAEGYHGRQPPPEMTGVERSPAQVAGDDSVPDEGPRDVPRSSMKRLFWEPVRGPDDQRSQATTRPPTLSSPVPPEPSTIDEALLPPSDTMSFPRSHAALPKRGMTGDSAGDAAEQLLSRVVNPFDDGDADITSTPSRPWRNRMISADSVSLSMQTAKKETLARCKSESVDPRNEDPFGRAESGFPRTTVPAR